MHLKICTPDFEHVIRDPDLTPLTGEFVIFERDGVIHSFKVTKMTVNYITNEVVAECFE